ncbi:MAG: NAD-dependent epimerase/dehydratase family protein [Planctomycetes bacterium]|nr:NAD-dependent epimerase/dehydratase family protein [Planctomycetota bacterium]
MRMLVTGARGFIGRSTAAAALRRGHRVRALVRPTADTAALDRSNDAGIEIVRHDLRDRDGLDGHLADVDVVVHLAAAMAGSRDEQFASTVTGTGHLLDAMEAAGARRLVGVSSIAVYDYARPRGDGIIDETSPLEPHPEQRGAYCHAKLEQEQLMVDRAAAAGIDWLILRPGVVYGPERLWTWRLGRALSSRLWVLMGTRAPLPLTYVENCADAIVIAAERDDVRGVALNIVDDETPTQLEYARRIRRQRDPAPFLVPVPWTLLRLLGATGLLARRELAARCRPWRYSNRRIRETLGWSPQRTLDDALAGRT